MRVIQVILVRKFKLAANPIRTVRCLSSKTVHAACGVSGLQLTQVMRLEPCAFASVVCSGDSDASFVQ